MAEIDTLKDIELIRKLKARYLRLADTKDWAGLAECFCEDVSCDWIGATTDPSTGRNVLPGSDAVLVGRAPIMKTIIEALSNVRSIHQGFAPEIEITGDNQAVGIWAMSDRLYIPTAEGEMVLQGYGHYHDSFERVDGRWKIKKLRLVRLKVEIVS